jgi:type II secretory ATPase GspE/PulE/Tfp pilus assembly ATPase PilB-like protein
MGVEPYPVASGLSILIAQRLVRLLCGQCKVAVPADGGSAAATLGFLPSDVPEQLYAPKGCDHCGSSGYRGRAAIFEVIAVDDEIRDSIRSKSPTRVYRQLFAARQIPTLRREGWARVRAGETTVEEVMRVHSLGVRSCYTLCGPAPPAWCGFRHSGDVDLTPRRRL